MRYIFVFALLLPLTCLAQTLNIIPQPNSVELTTGFLDYSKGFSIETIENSGVEVTLKKLLEKRLDKFSVSAPGAKKLILNVVPLFPDNNADAYRISVSKDSVVIAGYSSAGLFYGYETFISILQQTNAQARIPCMEIKDYAQYAYRGMLLDVSRHFFSKEVVKQYIDLMAQLKMNVFHWHLTDDQGWRIEIKKYPRLTEVGAWRTEKDGTKYGGFYTQEDIKEIVAYASERFVTIIPEIELPGHSSAAIAAYPFLSCNPNLPKTVPNAWGIKTDIYCPSDSTFQFLKNVLDEVCALFPSNLIHMGGDEAPKYVWMHSEQVQALIKKEGLKNEEELQHFFLKKIEDYLSLKGKRCIGWGEIVKGGLSDSVIVMSWLDKSAGAKALAHGNQVIMTPRWYCYFDYPQYRHEKKAVWWMLYLELSRVYKFELPPHSLAAEKQKLILGGQASVWTEYIADEKQLHHQIMPRLAAMAEALWSKNKNYKDFKKRLDNSAALK